MKSKINNRTLTLSINPDFKDLNLKQKLTNLYYDELEDMYDSATLKPDSNGIYHVDTLSREYFHLFPENKQPGSLYELDIPDPVIPKLLDWDKPLSEQTEFVKKAKQMSIVQKTAKNVQQQKNVLNQNLIM